MLSVLWSTSCGSSKHRHARRSRLSILTETQHFHLSAPPIQYEKPDPHLSRLQIHCQILSIRETLSFQKAMPFERPHKIEELETQPHSHPASSMVRYLRYHSTRSTDYSWMVQRRHEFHLQKACILCLRRNATELQWVGKKGQSAARI